jgi:hypothetical protein
MLICNGQTAVVISIKKARGDNSMKTLEKMAIAMAVRQLAMVEAYAQPALSPAECENVVKVNLF